MLIVYLILGAVPVSARGGGQPRDRRRDVEVAGYSARGGVKATPFTPLGLSALAETQLVAGATDRVVGRAPGQGQAAVVRGSAARRAGRAVPELSAGAQLRLVQLSRRQPDNGGVADSIVGHGRHAGRTSLAGVLERQRSLRHNGCTSLVMALSAQQPS